MRRSTRFAYNAFMPAEYHMRCLECDYILDGLPENRCPECGAHFDPSDSWTFSVVSESGLRRLWWALLGAAGPCAAITAALFVPAVGSIPGLVEILVVAVPVGWLIAGSSLSDCLRVLKWPELEQRWALVAATWINVLVLGSLLLVLCILFLELLKLA